MIACTGSVAEMCGRERFRERMSASAHCWAYLCAFTDASVNADKADASARHTDARERVCKLTFSVRGGRERYLVLSCGHL